MSRIELFKFYVYEALCFMFYKPGTKPSCLNQNIWTLWDFDLFAITYLVLNAPFEFANVKETTETLTNYIFSCIRLTDI